MSEPQAADAAELPSRPFVRTGLKPPLYHGTSVESGARISVEGLRLSPDQRSRVAVSESWATSVHHAAGWAFNDWLHGKPATAIMFELNPRIVWLLEHNEHEWVDEPSDIDTGVEPYIALHDGRRVYDHEYSHELTLFEPVPAAAIVSRETLHFDFDDPVSRRYARLRHWYEDAARAHAHGVPLDRARRDAAAAAGLRSVKRYGAARRGSADLGANTSLPWPF